MLTQTTDNQKSFTNEVARVGSDLVALLAGCSQNNASELIKGSVLWASLTYLPGLVSGMQDGTYEGQDILPEEYVAVPRLPAGWATTHEIQRLTSGGSRSDAYTAGVDFANAQILAAFPARGADTGEEPLCAHIARVAWQLHLLLEQIKRPTDEGAGSGNLVLMQFTAEGVARTMNQGLFIHFGEVPPVTNPAYLPPEDWKSRLEAIRQMVPEPEVNWDDAAPYDYYEGVRWTCAKFRDLCRDLTSEPRYAFVRGEQASKVNDE